MNQTETKPTTPKLANPSAKRIAFIGACWHKDIVDQARDSFIANMQSKAGIKADQIDVYDVPGSLEIPLQAKLLAKTGRYDIIVCSGLIVNGGIYRHDFVAAQVLEKMMDVQMETEVPVLSVVLTPIHFHEHQDHHKFFFDHFKIKGSEAADACIHTLKNIEDLQTISKAV